MTLSRFARMCAAIERENKTTEKARVINESLSSFSNISLVLQTLELDYDVNNIGSNRAIIWIADAFELFEDEVQTQEQIWGDIGEGMGQYIENFEDSTITMVEFVGLLNLNCSSINSHAYISISEAMRRMSGRELKWFIRYWLRTPRNGVSSSTVVRALSLRFPQGNAKKHSELHSASELFMYLESGKTPPHEVKYGKFIPPMLAHRFKSPFVLPTNYILDFKYDGNRYQIHKDDDMVMIFNRKGKIVTNQYPDIVDIVEMFNPNTCILDTEIYPILGDGSPAPHKKMATRVHSKDKDLAVESCPVKLVIFDVLQYMDRLLIDRPYSERLNHLKDFPSEYRVEQFTDGDVQRAYNIAINEGFEGIMIKDLDASYSVGKRSRVILKHKPPRIDLDVVITSAKYGEGKRSQVFGSFGISVKRDNEYIEIGSIGTGFSDANLTFLTTELKKIVDSYSDNVFNFLPRIVLEITCDLISQDAKGNYGLRFPRMTRIRQDKYAADCTTLTEIQEMAL